MAARAEIIELSAAEKDLARWATWHLVECPQCRTPSVITRSGMTCAGCRAGVRTLRERDYFPYQGQWTPLTMTWLRTIWPELCSLSAADEFERSRRQAAGEGRLF